MFFGMFRNKKEIEEIKQEVRGSFDKVKTDIDKVGNWISHLNSSGEQTNSRLDSFHEDLSTVKLEIEELKEMVSLFNDGVSKQMSKTNSRLFDKKTAVDVDETAVQTAVQTDKFNGISNLSVTEKAIVWILMNHDLKLSYEDIASMVGKTTSTVRGQINNIKQKSEGLVKEYVEQNGKKRVYIPDEIKEKMLKNVKVKVRKKKRV
jgi:predicted transcriptional regulator